MQTSECKVKGPIQENCASGCEKSWTAYQACAGRVAKLEHDEKANCLGQFLEHVQCIDKCLHSKMKR